MEPKTEQEGQWYSPYKGYDFGELTDVTTKYENPLEWVKDSLGQFLHMITLRLPERNINPVTKQYEDGFAPITEPKRLAFTREALTMCRVRLRKIVEGRATYEPVESVPSEATWIEEATMDFLLGQIFRIIPKRWYQGTDTATERMMNEVKLEAMALISKEIDAEILALKL